MQRRVGKSLAQITTLDRAQAVTNAHRAPELPEEFRATICQKYVVALPIAAGMKDGADWPGETGGGGFVVPNLTL